MAKTVNARTLPVQSIGYKYGKLIIPPYEVDIEFTPLEEAALESGINANMIPSTAGANNQLADKQYVDDNIASASATFRGNYNLVTDLNLSVSASHSDVAVALENVISTVDKNDYCYVDIPTSDLTPTLIAKTERYKFDGTAWNYEYSPTPIDKPSCKPFNEDWPTNTTLAAFCAAVVADTDSVIGQVYLGQLSCSGLPDGMGNGEAKVEVTLGLSGKALIITMTSTNLSPYHWEQTYYNSTLYGWKSWVPSEDLPEDHDYTSWDSAGTTQGGAGAMVIADESGYKTIVAITSSYVVTNIPVGLELYIPADAVLDGDTLITVYNDSALTVDSGIKVKIGAARKSTIDEALSMIYLLSLNEASKDINDSITAVIGDAQDTKDDLTIYGNRAYSDYNKTSVLGTALDDKTASTIYGAKAYAKDLVDTNTVTLTNLSAILAFATGTGTVTLSTNPEWKLVLLDYADKILLGKRRDNTWYFPEDLDDLLDLVIADYGN